MFCGEQAAIQMRSSGLRKSGGRGSAGRDSALECRKSRNEAGLALQCNCARILTTPPSLVGIEQE